MDKFVSRSWAKIKRSDAYEVVQKKVRRFNRWDMSLWAVWFYVLTVFVRPWRNSFSFDDAVYYKFAQSLSKFQFDVHILNFSGAWPQSLLGSIFLHLPVPGMVLLNLLTWCVFGILSFLFVRDHKDNMKLALAFFTFPVFIQMGVSFMPEMYVCLFLYLAYRWFFQTPSTRDKYLWVLYLLTILLITQHQPAVAFVFFWSLFLAMEKKHVGWHGLAASLVSIMVFSLLPKSDIHFSWQILFGKPFTAFDVIESFARTVQFLVVIGLFLIPLFPFKPKRGYVLTTLFMHFYAFGIIYLSSTSFIAAPSLPTQFFAKAGTCLFLSAGVWGWSGFFSGIKKPDAFTKGSLAATILICIFDAFTNAIEIRYLLPIALVWFVIFLRTANLRSGLWGHSNGYVFATMFFAVLFNLYNLNTTEAKWNYARELMREGTDPRSITAGKAWDLLNFEPECTEKAIQKANTSAEQRDTITKEHVILKIPNALEDQAHFRYVLRPYYALGMRLGHLSRLGNLRPAHLINYSVFGISNTIAVFDTGAFVLPWCLQ